MNTSIRSMNWTTGQAEQKQTAAPLSTLQRLELYMEQVQANPQAAEIFFSKIVEVCNTDPEHQRFAFDLLAQDADYADLKATEERARY